jgi:hypothetical protein
MELYRLIKPVFRLFRFKNFYSGVFQTVIVF